MPEREEVLSILKHEVTTIKDRYGVKKIGLFGSIARNEATQTSDIDILIELDPEKVTYKRYLEFESYLSSLFYRPIEIVTIDGVSPYILPYISREVIWV